MFLEYNQMESASTCSVLQIYFTISFYHARWSEVDLMSL
jgi:hypothetical protein